MNILDRYVLKQIAKPLIMSMGIGLAMLLAERLVRLLDFTLGRSNSLGLVFELLAYLVPHYLGTAIPAALFLGLLFGFNNLSKSHELDAMFAVGISTARLARPAILLSLLFSVSALFVFGWMQPYTRYAYRSTVFDIRNIDAFYLAQEGVFMRTGSRTFILDQLDKSNSSFGNVFIYDNDGAKGVETLTATRGVLVPVPGQTRPVLRLENGHRLKIEQAPNLAAANANPAFSEGEFSLMDTPLGKLNRDLFRPRGDDERELTSLEIYQQLDHPPRDASFNSMWSELHRRLVYGVIMLILPFLALPFAMGRPRSPRAFRIAAALIIVVGFYEIIEQGALTTKTSGISPYLTLWLPTLALAGFTVQRFRNAGRTTGLFERMLVSIETPLHNLATRIRKFRSREEIA
jgi:lipopolysaccharide export system permease protein